MRSVTLLDYGAGNVRSVANALRRLGCSVKAVERPEDIVSAERLVFPGVGEFGSMVRALERKGLFEPLRAYVRAQRPFLGICLGLQVLFEGSEESPGVPGLGFLRGAVRRFRGRLSVPHIGWNGIRARRPSRLFAGCRGGEKFYFVHSYHAAPDDPSAILATTDYGEEFASAVEVGNVVATQFHPEKSGEVGLRLLRNFVEAEGSAAAPGAGGSPTRLAKRIVACLDVRPDQRGRLVVTKGDRYDVWEGGAVRDLGDPVELARRYYDEGADEIAFLNITGFRDVPLEDLPMLEVLRRTSENVFVPLAIGGGIRDHLGEDGRTYGAVEVAHEYFRSGADKVSVGSEAVRSVREYFLRGNRPGRGPIERISRAYGSQAVVVSIDPRRVYVRSPSDVPHRTVETAEPGPGGERWCWFQCTVKGGRVGTEVDAITLARVCEDLGAGEILLNSIDRDGTGRGFDLELLRAVSDEVSIPVIASSGAGRAEHFSELFQVTEVEAALAAGIFHRREVSIAEVKERLAAEGVEVREAPSRSRGRAP
ncbi:MAG: imidazole glycerol phosphate synthase subunit HisF [Planctomycetota bacterium]